VLAALLVPLAMLGSLLAEAGPRLESFLPGFELVPDEVAQTETVTATGVGWGDVSFVEVWGDDPVEEDVLLARVPVVDGAFASEPFAVSLLAPGPHRVYACAACPSAYDDVSGPVVWDSLVVLPAPTPTPRPTPTPTPTPPTPTVLPTPTPEPADDLEPASASWWPWLATGALVAVFGAAFLLRRPRRAPRRRVGQHAEPELRPRDAPLAALEQPDLPAPTLSWRVHDDELVSVDEEGP
jgi:hypothetical protein